MNYIPTIGLEVHAELKTRSKMFCGCKNEPHGSEPNAHVCPVCLAHPGSLPVPNQEAIQHVLLFGEAVDATFAEYSEFDRKNYFYPDIPKAYQISQYKYPFLTGGSLLGIELTRVHLEEDTARNQHDQVAGSLVDFNRAGVPLMELVTEPVIHDAVTAGAFARELQLVLRTLDISDANMEKGEMRVEANISVSTDPEMLGTKVEVKNLNSFRVVEAAIEFEIARQIAVLEAGGEVTQETRGWDEAKRMTFSQRSKETAKDYRYFPDPDLPKINLSSATELDKNRLAEINVILPSKKRLIYENLGLKSSDIEQIISNQELDDVVDFLIKKEKEETFLQQAVNYLLSDIVSLTERGQELSLLNQEAFSELIELLESNEIGSRVAKDILPLLFTSKAFSVQEYVAEHDLGKVADEGRLSAIVEQIISENPTVVAEYKAGKEQALKFLVGQGMKISRGTADPAKLSELLAQAIKTGE